MARIINTLVTIAFYFVICSILIDGFTLIFRISKSAHTWATARLARKSEPSNGAGRPEPQPAAQA